MTATHTISEDFGDETVTSHHFGEGAKLTYGSYLQLEQVLSAQVLRSDPPAHDELLFITIQAAAARDRRRD